MLEYLSIFPTDQQINRRTIRDPFVLMSSNMVVRICSSAVMWLLSNTSQMDYVKM